MDGETETQRTSNFIWPWRLGTEIQGRKVVCEHLSTPWLRQDWARAWGGLRRREACLHLWSHIRQQADCSQASGAAVTLRQRCSLRAEWGCSGAVGCRAAHRLQGGLSWDLLICHQFTRSHAAALGFRFTLIRQAKAGGRTERYFESGCQRGQGYRQGRER